MEIMEELTSELLEDRKKYFIVGEIASTFALKGEVKLYPLTDYPERFTKGLEVFLDTKKDKILKLKVESSRQAGRFVIIKFKGIDDINDIERYKGCSIYIDRKDAVKLNEGEHYVADLIGLTVKDEEGNHLGEITDVISTGANDVYEIKLFDNSRLVYFPVIDECVLDIDITKGFVTVHVMEGLL